MSYGPITHAGSNWRKLCAKYGLDPLDATADDVRHAIQVETLDLVNQALDQSIAEATDVAASATAIAGLREEQVDARDL